MADTKTTEPRYQFTFRFKENTRKALNKIQKAHKKSQNEAVELSVLAFANQIK